jgi:arylsulfatase A-like enzyme
VAELLRDRKTDRFFLYVHYLDVHDWLLLDRGYAHSVEIQDTRIGELLDMLAREGLLDGTTIVFTSDHGEALNETHAIPSMPYHFGNPSFEPVIHVPLIVAPPVFDDTEAMVRGTDVRNLIRRIAGEEPLSRLGSLDGLYLSEHRYRTWRDGRYKSVWPRRPGHAPLLFDLVLDPGERLDAAERLPQVLSAHRARIAEASQALATRPVESRDEDSDDDLERLRALGYIE